MTEWKYSDGQITVIEFYKSPLQITHRMVRLVNEAGDNSVIGLLVVAAFDFRQQNKIRLPRCLIKSDATLKLPKGETDMNAQMNNWLQKYLFDKKTFRRRNKRRRRKRQSRRVKIEAKHESLKSAPRRKKKVRLPPSPPKCQLSRARTGGATATRSRKRFHRDFHELLKFIE